MPAQNAENRQNLYSISKVAQILRVSVHTLRNWEREGKFRPSFKTEKGYRQYTLSDVEIIKGIIKELDSDTFVETTQQVRQAIKDQTGITPTGTSQTALLNTLKQTTRLAPNIRRAKLASVLATFLAVSSLSALTYMYTKTDRLSQKIMDLQKQNVLSSTTVTDKAGLTLEKTQGNIVNKGYPFDLGETVLSGAIVTDNRGVIFPFSGDNQSLGESGHPWKSIFAKDFTVDKNGNLNVGGIATFDENADFKSKVTVRGALDVDKDVRLRGETIQIGEDSSSTVTINANAIFQGTATLSGAVALDGTTSNTFTLDSNSSGVSDTDISLYFSDDGSNTAHYLRWDDGLSTFILSDQAILRSYNNATPPTTLGNGTMYYDTDNDFLYYDKEGTWTIVGGGLQQVYDVGNSILLSVASGDIRIRNSSEDMLFADESSGRIGIGTTNPLFKLDVAGNIGPDGNNTRDLGSSSKYFANGYITNLYGGTSGAFGYWNKTGTILTPLTAGDTIATTGNVGVGNTSTSYKLDVNGTGRFTGAVTLDSTLDSNGDVSIADTNVAFDGASTIFTTTGAFTLTPGGTVLIGDGGDTLQLSSSDWAVSTTGALTGISGISNDGGYTQSGTSANTFTGTSTFSNTTYSALFTGGNVGIGTTAPSSELEVYSADSALSGVRFSSSTAGANYSIGVGDGTPFNDALVFLSGTTQYAFMNSSGNWGFGFAGTPGSRLSVSGGFSLGSSYVTYVAPSNGAIIEGNVGIGTTNPQYKLEVNGTGYFGGALTVAGGITATGHLLPSADNTYDLGSNTARWRDLYLGPNTLHIGTSTSDEGTVAYDTNLSSEQYLILSHK